MSEPLLNVMKIMLLCGLYLFFVRVLWSVFSELRDPRSVARKGRASKSPATAAPAQGTTRGPTPSPAPGLAPMAAGSAGAAPMGGGVAVAAPASLGQLMVIDPPNLAGVTYMLGSGVTIGRAPTNGIHLDDTYISTVHARLFATNGEYFIEDLDSRNGTLLNAHSLVATTALVAGDRLQVGGITLEFA